MQRNLILDIFKIILSILVIGIHCQPIISTEFLSEWLLINGVARIAVPSFFIISAYYISQRLDDKQYLIKWLKHLVIVYIVWSLIYLPSYISTVEPRSLLTFALMGYYHLWFIPALVGAIILLIIAKKLLNDKIILILAIVLYLIGYYLEYKGSYYRYYNNAIFAAFPFVTIAYLSNKYSLKIKNSYLMILVALSGTTLIIESYLAYVRHADPAYSNFYLSLLILCPSLFLLIKNSKLRYKKNLYFGQIAAGIYLTHILIITEILPTIYHAVPYKIIVTTALAIVLSIFIIWINKHFKYLL